METMEYIGTLVVMECHCGLKHGVPKILYIQYRDRIISCLYCPAGHSYVPAGKSDADKLRAQVTSLRDTLDSCRQARDLAWRSQATTKGHITRLKKRIAAGVCPCCRRTFQDLAKHMKGQHPRYVE